MKLEEIRTRIETAYEALMPMRGHMENDHSEELSLELGRLLGQLVKTWAIVRRDIENSAADKPKA